MAATRFYGSGPEQMHTRKRIFLSFAGAKAAMSNVYFCIGCYVISSFNISIIHSDLKCA